MTGLRPHLLLQHLLDENRNFALDGRGTTNHCPMVLCALAQMGASDARLREFFSYWTARHAVLLETDSAAIERHRFCAQLGRKEAFAALRNCFEDWVIEAGADNTVREVLQSIPPAPASGAFHGVIRLAYGLEAAHTGEIAAGLAALVCGNLALDVDLTGKAPASSAGAALLDLSRALGGSKFAGDRITTRLDMAAADTRFRTALPAPPQHPGLFEEMALAALAVYRSTGNFTALHMVTGLHAARLVLARLPEESATQWLPALWIALCAAYVSFGAPPVIEVEYEMEHKADHEATDSEDWSALFASAVQSNDDHDIKFVYTCRQENTHRPTPAYYAAARQRLRG